MTRSPSLVVASRRRRAWISPALGAWEGTLDGAPVDAGAGRGNVVRARLGPFAAIVRTYRRGGLLGALLPDVFVSPDRALAEVEALERLAPLGLSPRPLVLEVRGAIFLRLRIAVEEIAGAANLRAVARVGAGIETDLARRVGCLVRRMHDAGVSHRDLHVGNVLVRVAAGATEVSIIDLDGARVFAGGLPAPRREREILRLCRSLDKWTATARTSAAARAAFLRAALPRGRRVAVLRRARRLHAIRAFFGRRPV